MSRMPFQQIDAFTTRAYGGNPAAVLVLDSPLSDAAMQAIALEMNLSETAFVLPPDGEGLRQLRWFTPATEVPLCGHATLATAHALRESGAAMPLRFRTLSGELIVHAEGAALRMDFPADPVEEVPPPKGLAEALGLPALESVHRGAKGWVVRVSDQAAVLAARPSFGQLQRFELGPEAMVMSVTAPSHEEGVDFASRVFAPWAGVDEDPVTGVAHTSLTPYWAEVLGKDEMEARQISARGGELRVRNDGDRVHLIGSAVSVAEGSLLLPTA